MNTTTINQLSEYTNHSGGALGADTEWDEIGKKFGMVNNNHYYTGSKTPNGNTEISEADYTEGQRAYGTSYNNAGDESFYGGTAGAAQIRKLYL